MQHVKRYLRRQMINVYYHVFKRLLFFQVFNVLNLFKNFSNVFLHLWMRRTDCVERDATVHLQYQFSVCRH